MNQRKTAVALYALFLLLIALLRTVDVAPLGPLGSTVGLSTCNGAIFAAVSPAPVWDRVSDGVLALALLVAIGWAMHGAMALFRSRSFKQVDSALLKMGLLYCGTALCNVLFEALFINGRPVLIEGALEPGFPSSHVLAVGVIFGATLIYLSARVTPFWWRILSGSAVVLVLACALGRLCSGMHWPTDILGALLLSGALSASYGAWCARR